MLRNIERFIGPLKDASVSPYLVFLDADDHLLPPRSRRAAPFRYHEVACRIVLGSGV